ncbi:MAG TPA: hypothetical protein VMF51_02365 [Nocardioides sp.]|uniref:hypothetical protein n=1 Tax=Nocardioides sp. TaxID=35761 RepID=UPI002C148FD6|nr:hypothetical protein [Nocardioides sp.]HTW13940.1 hypothetical protein [Nocardioides sp.]
MEGRIDSYVLWLRALLVAGVAFFIGIAGHVTAEGLLPGPVALLFFFVFAVLLSAPLLNRPASRLRLVVMTVGGQALLHLALSVSGGHVGERSGGAVVAPRTTTLSDLPVVNGQRHGSLLDAYAAGAGTSSAPAPALPVGHVLNDLTAHAPMMLAHLVVAAVVGLWLARGERCLWTVLALTGRRLVLVLTTVLAPPVLTRSRRVPAAEADLPLLRSRWLSQPLSRRGPPVPA